MYRALLLALALAAPALAGVTGPTEIEVPVGRLAAVPLVVDADEADYRILGDDLDGLREYDPDPKRLKLRVIGYAPGTAWVVVSSVKGGKLEPAHIVKVKIQGRGPVNPPDPPGPPVDPPPDPPVPKAPAWVVVVTDQDADSPGVAAVIASRRFRDQLGNWGLRFRVYDKASPAVSARGYAPHLAANKLGPPAFLVLDADGLVVGVGVLPGDEAKATEAIRKAAGK